MTSPRDKEDYRKLRKAFLSDLGLAEIKSPPLQEEEQVRFGQVALSKGLITPVQLEKAFRQQEEEGNKRKLGEILLDRGFLTREDVDTVIQSQKVSRVSSIGTIGPYHLLEELGRGGGGRVFRAIHKKLLKQVAIKILEPSGELSEETLKRFNREAVVAARLQHPNIVAVHDVGHIEEVHYIVMDYLEGTPLSKWLGNPENMVRDRLRMLHKVAKAVGYAHQQGVLHRDIKPENVIVRHSGEPVLVDFGLARGPGDLKLTQEGVIMGTPLFMSPEQVQGDFDKVGVPSDIYSLGVMVFFALTGSYPFFFTTPQQLYDAILTKEPPIPTKVRKGLSPDIDAICGKCLEKDPKSRYVSAIALADDLYNCAEGDPISATRISPVSRAWRRVRRRPGMIATVSLFLLMIGIGTAVWVNQQARESHLNQVLKINTSYSNFHSRLSNLVHEAETERYLSAGNRKEEEKNRIIDAVDRQVASVEDQTGVGEGYRAWVRFLLGTDTRVPPMLDAAIERHPENPFLHLIAVRVHLRLYLDQARWPQLRFTVEAVQEPYATLRPVETENMKTHMKAAQASLRAAHDLDIWKDLPALQWGEDLYNGFEAYASGDWDRAIDLLKGIGDRSDLALEGNFFTVISYSLMKETEKAIDIARRFVKHRPELVPARRQLAHCLHFQGKFLMTQNKNGLSELEESNQLFRELSSDMTMDPQVALAELAVAFALKKTGDVPAARKHVDVAEFIMMKVLGRFDRDVSTLANLGTVFYLRSTFEADPKKSWDLLDRSGTFYERALELDPQNDAVRQTLLGHNLKRAIKRGDGGSFTQEEWDQLQSELKRLKAFLHDQPDVALLLQSQLYFARSCQEKSEGNFTSSARDARKAIELADAATDLSPNLSHPRQIRILAFTVLAQVEPQPLQTIRNWVAEVENQITAFPEMVNTRPVLIRFFRFLIDQASKEDQIALGVLEVEQRGRLVKENPASAQYRISLGDAMTRQGLRDPAKAREWCQNAITEYTEADRLDPNSPAVRRLVERYMQLKGVEPSFPAKKLCVQKALEIADRSVKLTPKSAESYTLRANVRLDPIIADRTGARADIAKALELMPGHPQALHSRAKLHFQERNYEEALADLDRSGYSKNIDGMMLKAKILYLQTKFPVALKEVDRLLKREPSNIEALMLRAFTRVSMKDKKNARQDLLAAREIAVKQGRTDVLHAIDRYLKQEKLDSDR